MTFSLRACAVTFLGLLSVSEAYPAQTKDRRPDDKSLRAADGGGGTMVKKAPVAANEDLGQLVVRRENARAGSAGGKDTVTTATSLAAVDTETLKVELARLRQEIKDKQRKVELLMHMFVTDEQVFVRDPTREYGETDEEMKRRYEQEELRRQTAELGRMRARLESLTKSVEESAEKVR